MGSASHQEEYLHQPERLEISPVPIIKFLMGYSWRVQKIMSKIK